jgi:LuxR family maltose regulon positive regulatory protein
MTEKELTVPIIRTKLQRPRLPEDLICRPRLISKLNRGLDRKLTLISAQAGAGKSTLLAQWLADEQHKTPSAWLSLDEHDNDLIVFLSYLCEAVRTVYPAACAEALELLRAPQTPSVRAISAMLVNGLNDLVGRVDGPDNGGPPQKGVGSHTALILALDDYQNITKPEIHEVLSSFIAYLPQGVHLVLASRTDPPLKLGRLRARREMTEVRSTDLRLTSEEVQAFLEAAVGMGLSSKTIALLEEKTEGWMVGLRLAALSLSRQPDDEAFVTRFQKASSANIIDYLMSEVVSQQPPEIEDFMLRTSVLDRFCAPVCEAVTGFSEAESREIIEGLYRDNLFLVPLDLEGTWYRYHHLLRDLLRLRLERLHSAREVTSLHTRAGARFAQDGWIDEALQHLLAANNIAAAADLVARHRYALMNGTQWQRVDRYLRQFSPDMLDRYPDLLMLKMWLLYHRGRWAELPAALERLEAAMRRVSLPPEQVNHLQGEISAVRSVLYYHAGDPESALTCAQKALEKTPRELWIVRILARLYLAGVLHMRGDSGGAYAAIYRGFEEEETQSSAFKATLVMTVCNLRWLDADLLGMARAAKQCITLSRQSGVPHILNYGHYHLGRVCYQQNDLTSAEGHFATVVQQPYLSYGECFVYSAYGLALVHQVRGRPGEARAVLESASTFMLETGNTTLMPVIQAFQAEIALKQGQIAVARQWADLLDPIPPLTPIYGFFSPHLTLVRVWLAQGTVDSRGKTADLLKTAREFVESAHNTRVLIEVLALQALLYEADGDEPAALGVLERAITLAEPGRFVRLFVDLGPPMARMLDRLRRRGVAPDYVAQILAAFGTKDQGRMTETLDSSSVMRPQSPRSKAERDSSALVEPLTPREREVLELLGRHLTNKEIATELVVSPGTVKTHTLNIYRKLDVHTRRQAIARARELDILPPK